MSFNISLCYNHNEHNKIRKTVNIVHSLLGTLRDECSIVDPVVLVEYNGVLNDVNYAWIEIFRRNYFITDIVSVRNKLWRIHLHCDVLMTYANAILATEAIIAKNETNWDSYLDDGQFRAASNPYIVTNEFPAGFGDGSMAHRYILALAGTNVPAL